MNHPRSKLYNLLDKRHHIARKNFSIDSEGQTKQQHVKDCICDHSESRLAQKTSLSNDCSECVSSTEDLSFMDDSDRNKRNNIERNNNSNRRTTSKVGLTFENDLVNRFISYICGKAC